MEKKQPVQVTSSTPELMSVRSMEMSTSERAGLNREILATIVGYYGAGATVRVSELLEDFDGSAARTAPEIRQAIDLGEEMGILVADSSTRSVTVV